MGDAILRMAALSVLLGGFGCSPGREEGCVRVVSWADWRELAIDREIVDSFEVANPGIPVCYESLEGSGIYREKVLTSIAAGTPPDVMLLDAEDLPAFVGGAPGGSAPGERGGAPDAGAAGQRGAASPRGVLLDLAAYAPRAGVDPGAFHPLVLSLFRDEGRLWAFPKDFTPMVIYYNKDVFDGAGVAYPAGDWTWEEFLDTARRLTLDADGDGEPDQWGFGWSRQFFYLQAWIWAGGGDILGPGEGDRLRASGHLDAPATTEAVRFYLDLVGEHGVSPRIEMTRRAMGGVTRLFYSGRIGMMLSGHWSGATLQLHEEAGRLRYGVVPVPHREGVEPATVLYASGWAVPREAEHRRWAVQLAAFLAGPLAQRIRARGGLAVPSLTEVARETAALDTTGREAVFLRSTERGRPPWGTRVGPWREINDYLVDLLDRPLVRGEPVPEVAREVAERIDRALEREERR